MNTEQVKYTPRLKQLYDQEIIPKLKEKFGYKNSLACPRLSKIVINMGVGEAKDDIKIIDKAKKDLSLIAGQVPRVTRARKAISNFKIRKGAVIGCSVTLRKKMMYEFLDRFISTACPRIKDFRGFSPRSFDGRGNYTLGINEQTIFAEIDLDKTEKTLGMDITIVTTAASDAEAKGLLALFKFPFRR
ncbi:MAG: 50S ribosomal protein L5 [Candidatus Omnitrophica bacterium]|nr:50S ribosomal protein L5 [Candidatus Omnitrophota bacterium]